MSSPRNLPSGTHLFSLMETLPSLTPGVGVLGEDMKGNPLLLNLLETETAHALVLGDQAAGKTAVLRALATSLVLSSRQAELQLLLIDTNLAGGNDTRNTLHSVSLLPHNLTNIVVSVEDATAMLDFLVEEMAYRKEQGINLPHIAVFIDHVLPLLAEGGDLVADALPQLLRHGTEAGLHLLVAARPSELPVMVALLREPWPVRLIGNPNEGNGNGQPSSAGQFVAQMSTSETRFQAAYLDDLDVQRCLEDLDRYRPPALIARPFP